MSWITIVYQLIFVFIISGTIFSWTAKLHGVTDSKIIRDVFLIMGTGFSTIFALMNVIRYLFS